MKQLTECRSRLSEERAWELIWLATGLIAPSQLLTKDLVQFLKTRQHPVAADSYNRLQKTLRSVPHIQPLNDLRKTLRGGSCFVCPALSWL